MRSFLQGYLNRLLMGIFKMDKTVVVNWDGKICQRNLELDTALLDNFKIDIGLPCQIVRGVVEELSLNVPWMTITRERISIKAKNCFALLRIDLRNLHEFCVEREKNRGRKMMSEMEEKLIETFRKIKNKNSNYISSLVQGLLKSLQIHIENFRIRVEFIDLDEPLVGGYEIIFNEFNYDNLVSNIAETRFDGEFLTNGLNIVDFRLKGIKKDKLVLLKYRVEQIMSQPLEEFKQLFQNEPNASYLVYPFLVQANFTSMYKDITKETYKGVRSIEFSPLTLNISNQDLQLASAFGGLMTTVQEYYQSRRLVMSHALRDTDLSQYLAALRLNALLHRVWSMKSTKRMRAHLAFVRRVKDEYIYSYETKIFNLMENEFESGSDRLYDASLAIPSFDGGEEKTIDEVVQRCEEIEKSLHASIVLNFREQAMSKCRNANYFKSRLIERKKFINAKKEQGGGFSGILRKGINKIWGSSSKDSIADIDRLMQTENTSKVDNDIKEKLIKNETKTEAIVELKFPVIKVCLSRNQQKLLTLDVSSSKYSEYKNFVNKEGRKTFKLQNVALIDGEGKVFFEIMRNTSFADESPISMGSSTLERSPAPSSMEEKSYKKIYNCMEVVISYPLIKDVETETYSPGKMTADVTIENIHLSFSRELLSKLIYFSIDFTKARQGIYPQTKVSKKSSSLAAMMNKSLKLDEDYKTFQLTIRSVTAIVTHSVKQLTAGLRFVPSFSLQKNQIDVGIRDFEIFYEEDLFDFKRAMDYKEQLRSVPKFLRPCDINLCLLRGTSNRLSLDVKTSNVEVFFCEMFIEICSQIVVDLGSIKLLNTDSFLEDLRKDIKYSAKPQKKKTLLSSRLGPTLSNRKSSVQSKRVTVTGSRKASGSAMGNSEFLDEEFFDAFEDETDLFAHNELKSKFDLLENVGMMMPSQLDVIEENHKFMLRNYESDEDDLENQPKIELAITLVLDEVVLLFYSRNDLHNYLQANFSNIRMFSDFKEMSLRIKDIVVFLKQNLLTLLIKDFAGPISHILSILKPSANGENMSSPKPNFMAEDRMDESSPMALMSPENKHYQKDGSEPNMFLNLKQWFLSCSEDLSLEIEIEHGFSLYMTQQIGQIITPGMFFSIKPSVVFNAKTLKIQSSFKLDVYNEELGFYEPFIEELSIDIFLNAEKPSLKIETLIHAFLLNLKPSILKNLFDYLSLYSSQKIKSSAERNSVITIKNETGVAITYLVNQSGLSKSLKPYEVVNVNLVFMPQLQESGNKLRQEQVDHSVSALSFVENKTTLLKIVGRVGDDKANTGFEANRQQLSTSFFSKKKLQLEIPSFNVKYTLDLSNMTDAHIKLTEQIFLVAKLEVDNYHTVLTLRSNYRITNKLDFDVECSAYLQKSAYAKDEATGNDLFAKKRKKSEVLSEGDNLSAADSIDLSVNEPSKRFIFRSEIHDKPKTVAFDNTQASEKEERHILLFKFIIKSKGKKFLPLLKNFPKNYFLVIKPAQLEFFESISTQPGMEMSQVKSQSLKMNRVYFEDLFRRSCSSKLSLKHSKYNELIFALKLNNKFVTVDKDLEDPKSREDASTPIHARDGQEREIPAPLLCEYDLDLTYPLTIINCLPSNLSFKLNHLTSSMLREPDSFSRVTLSRVGDEIYSRCFQETDQFEGQMQRVSKEKILGISADSYPLLTIETEESKSKSFIYLQKYIDNVALV